MKFSMCTVKSNFCKQNVLAKCEVLTGHMFALHFHHVEDSRYRTVRQSEHACSMLKFVESKRWDGAGSRW